MTAVIVSGTANPGLAAVVASLLGTSPAAGDVERFPDGELRPVVTGVRGADVYVVQPTGPPVNEHVVELLLLLDACRRGGAARVTAVVPYFGYARQDRRASTGQAVGARVVSDALVSAGAQRLVVVDPHTAALEAMCSVPVEMLTAVPGLAGALEPTLLEDCVVVAPDLGAAKLAERLAALLGRPVGIVRKSRLSGSSVRAGEMVGDVRGRSVVVVDDMISTGGTIEVAVRLVRARGARDPIVVAATHGLLVGPAYERLSAADIRRLLVTDTLPAPLSHTVPFEVHSVAPLIAEAVGRLHRDEDLADLLLRA